MSDCNARGREFQSWLGQNKFTKVMGSDGISMRSVMVSDCII